MIKETPDFSTLLKSKEFVKLLQDNLLEYVSIFDLDGTLLHTNKVPNGYKMEDVIGLSKFDFLVEPYKSKLIKIHDKVIQTGKSINTHFISRSGRHYLDTILKFDHGGESYIVTFAIDTTEITKSQSIHKISFDSSPIGVGISQDGKIIEFNDQFANILEWSQENLIGKTTEELITPFSVNKIRVMSQKRLSGDEDVPTTYLLDVITENGDYKTVRHSVSVSSYQGEPALFSYIQDIEEELKLRDDREKLIKQYNFLLENSPFGILIVNAETEEILYINEKLLDLLQGKASDYLGKEAKIIVQKDMQEKISQLGKMRLEGKNIPTEYEIDLITKGGEVISVQNIIQITEYHDTPAFINYMKDNREFQRIQKERDDMKEIIEQTSRLEKIGTMAAGLAHDFNNLLVGIDGTLGLLEYEVPKEYDTFYEHLDTIKQASKEAKNIIKQMLDLSGKSKVDHHELEITSLIQSIHSLLTSFLSENIECIINSYPSELFVFGNETQLKQVIVNIVSNANQVIDKKYGQIEISFGKESVASKDYISSFIIGKINHEKYVSISISNNGPKIDDTALNHIFDPFYSSSTSKGRGLGLSVVIGIIRSHNGFLIVNSTNERTEFKVMIPEYLQKSTLLSSHILPNNNASTTQNDGSYGVLVVDDNPTVLKVTQMMIENLGHSVISISSRTKALDTLKNFQFDLVIMDLSMPDMSFDEFYNALDEIEPYNSKVLLISGYSEENVSEKIKDDDVSFLNKPFTLDELNRAINELMN